MSVWQSHTSEDGRVYYYNTRTSESSWEKPEELLTPLERALAASKWKEYTAEGGSKYWYHEDTQESVWEIPDEIRDIIAANPDLEGDAPNEASSTTTSAAPTSTQHASYENTRDAFKYTSKSIIAPGKLPDYESPEDAVNAFKDMLRERKIDGEQHTWPSAMKLLIQDPRYWAIPMPLERKRVFDEYSKEARAERAKKRHQAREEQLKAMTMALAQYSNIKYYTRWRTVKDSILSEDPVFRSVVEGGDENDVKLCHYAFNLYRQKLREAYEANQARERKAAITKLGTLLNTLDISATSAQWLDTFNLLKNTPKFADDPRLSAMPRRDILIAYEEYIRTEEKRQNEQVQKIKKLQRRKERKVREEFAALLQELHQQGQIKASTKWMNIRQVFENDKRYIEICGQPGSTPLELFWDIVEEEGRKLKLQREQVIDLITAKRFTVDDNTPFDSFAQFVRTTMAETHKDAAAADSISQSNLETIFVDIKLSEARKREEDRQADKRRIQRAQDNLRGVISDLEDPRVGLNDKWEDVKPRISHTEEYARLEKEDLRREAFDKFIRRLQEWEKDRERRRKMAGPGPGPGRLPDSLPPPHMGVPGQLGPGIPPPGGAPIPAGGAPGRYQLPRGYPPVPPPPQPYYRGGYDPHQPFLKY